MPSGQYDRTKYERDCEYCLKTFTLSTRGWKDHAKAHVRKGDQKRKDMLVISGSRSINVERSPSTAIVLADDLTCKECKAEGKVRTFKNNFALKIHLSRFHKVHGPHYHSQRRYRMEKRNATLRKGEMNGNETIEHQTAEAAGDEERLAYYSAGYTTRTIEVLAASVNRPPALLTSRILSILTMGLNPVREELRGKGKVPHMRGAATA